MGDLSQKLTVRLKVETGSSSTLSLRYTHRVLYDCLAADLIWAPWKARIEILEISHLPGCKNFRVLKLSISRLKKSLTFIQKHHPGVDGYHHPRGLWSCSNIWCLWQLYYLGQTQGTCFTHVIHFSAFDFVRKTTKQINRTIVPILHTKNWPV